MPTEHEQLVEAAKKAINAVFSDDSVDQDTTRESLQELLDELELLQEALG
jgi:hypothetical protein